VKVVDERKHPFGWSVNTYGPLDTESLWFYGGEDENQRNQNGDDDDDSQNHAVIREVQVLTSSKARSVEPVSRLHAAITLLERTHSFYARSLLTKSKATPPSNPRFEADAHSTSG